MPPQKTPAADRTRWIVLFGFAVSYAVGVASNWWISGLAPFIIGGVAAYALAVASGGWKSEAFDDFLRSPVANVIFWTIVGLAAIAYFADIDPMAGYSEIDRGRF